MQKLNEALKKFISKIKDLKKGGEGKKRKKILKKFRRTIKKALKKDRLVKIIIALATLAMLLPLFLPFLG